MEVVTEQAVVTTQPSPAPKSFISFEIVKIALEIIALACMFGWFRKTTNALSQQVTDLTNRLEEAEATIERHESVLKKIMTLLSNRNSKSAVDPEEGMPQKRVVVAPTASSPAQTVSQKENREDFPIGVLAAPFPDGFLDPIKKNLVSEPVQSTPMMDAPSLFISGLMGSMFGGGAPVQQPPSEPVQQPTITEITEELDSELMSEIAELHN